MTKNIKDKLIVSCHKFYINVNPQNEITLNTCDQRVFFNDIIYLQAKGTPLKIALGEIFLP